MDLGANFRNFGAEQFVSAFLNSNTLLPADAEGVAGNVGIYLIAHIGLQDVVGAGFAPGSFHFDDAGAVEGTVNIVLLVAIVNEQLVETLCDIASFYAGLDLLFRPCVSLTAELHDIAALTFQLAQADGVADSRGVAIDLGRQVQNGR